MLLPHLAEGRAPAHAEDGLWLTPIENRAGGGRSRGEGRRGLFGMTLEQYLELVDATGRVVRGDKRGAIPSHLRPILERLDIDPRRWSTTMGQVTRLFGSAIGSAEALAREAVRRGKKRVIGCMDIYREAAIG